MTSTERSGIGGGGTRTATRRTVLIIWCVLMGGALGLTVVAAVAGPGIWSRVGDRGSPAAWVVFVMALACLLASRVLPSRVTPLEGTVESIAVARSTVAVALSGGVALLAPLAWMVSGNPIALAALAISIVGLLLAMPTRRRWQKLTHTLEATSGRKLGTAADVSGTPPRLSRNVIALLALIGLAAAATPVLSGIFFWNEELLRRPSSPTIRALLFLMLASMLSGFGILRFLGASASRHPRWQRAHGVLLLALASYLLLQLVRVL